MQAQLLNKWKVTQMDLYDDSSDQDAHVKAYLIQTNIFCRDLRVHCRLFPTTLKGPTLEWYYSVLEFS